MPEPQEERAPGGDGGPPGRFEHAGWWGGRGHHHPHGPRGRPPWWPEGEPFPPIDRTAWHGMRRRFLRRVGLFLALFFGLMFAANAVAVVLLSGDAGDDRRFGPPFGAIAVGLLITFLVVGRVVRGMARPVGDIMEAADRLASGDYTARVQERGPRDMRRLARSFNEMAQRLEGNEEQRRNLLADIAHELRTPLTVIRGNTEGMLDGLYAADREHLAPVLEETRVMARLLDDLQTLSTAEAGALRLHLETVDPADLVSDAAAAFRERARAAGITLEHDVAPDLAPVEVDPVRIGEVLSNLLQNAIRHTPPAGTVTLTAQPLDDGVEFAVADTGPGIPPEVLPHVFDRFVKAADSGGAGLGLAIARTLVQAHGGRIEAQSPDCGGTVLRFVLPAGAGPARSSGESA